MSDAQGNFVWYELATTDVDGAMRFYGDVVGWGSERFGGPEPAYWIWKAGETGIGGVMRQDGTPHWVGYVYVDDVDERGRKAAALGGSCCVPPHDIPTVGRIAVVADPQGAVIAMIKPHGPDRPPPAGPPAGHVVWRELLTDDPVAALRFYRELFGWQEIRALDMGSTGAYHIYGKGGRDFGGMMKRPTGYPLAPHFLHYVHVDDLDAAVERVRRAGGQVWMGPMPIPTGERIAQCADPQGAAFALHGT